ncbi:protein FAM229A isoform X1 [Rhineura floridana]|uniref:protein FAM229A isoform X1 n=1 Tax=Rhineura floridana TaxID=261503 RepID=UPI002AC8302C|nr:protein FAM229A isoform X1 [Rhineura floridana]
MHCDASAALPGHNAAELLPLSGLHPSLPSAVSSSSCPVDSREHSSAFDRQVWGSDMSSQETPQARRFPIEAGDSPSLATAPETQEPVAPERTATRQLRRCPGCHCLTLPNVPIDVYIAMGGSHRPRTT